MGGVTQERSVAARDEWHVDVSPRWLLVVILGFCFLLRGVVGLVVLDRDPHVVTQVDSPSYMKPALALLDDGRFSHSTTDARPEFVRTPGYPAFIALVYVV